MHRLDVQTLMIFFLDFLKRVSYEILLKSSDFTRNDPAILDCFLTAEEREELIGVVKLNACPLACPLQIALILRKGYLQFL